MYESKKGEKEMNGMRAKLFIYSIGGTSRTSQRILGCRGQPWQEITQPTNLERGIPFSSTLSLILAPF